MTLGPAGPHQSSHYIPLEFESVFNVSPHVPALHSYSKVKKKILLHVYDTPRIPKQLPRASSSSYVDEKQVEHMEVKSLPSVSVFFVYLKFVFCFFLQLSAASWENISLFTLVGGSHICGHVDI